MREGRTGRVGAALSSAAERTIGRAGWAVLAASSMAGLVILAGIALLLPAPPRYLIGFSSIAIIWPQAAHDAELAVTSNISPEGVEKTGARADTASPSSMQVTVDGGGVAAPLMSMADNALAVAASHRMVCPKNPVNFNVDNVRVAKPIGGGLHNCTTVRGMVLKGDTVGSIKKIDKAKVVVIAGGVDTTATETKGNILIHRTEQWNPDDLGYVDTISVEDIDGARVIVVRNEQGGNSVTMVLLRGSTNSILDDLERAVDDGVNTYKALCKDNRIMHGAAATEIELARKLKEFSFLETGLDQYAIGKFVESFEMIPKTLAENVGLNAMEIISTLYVDDTNGNVKVGIDLKEIARKDVSTLKEIISLFLVLCLQG
ncbi:T-complex protein 1 subunit theta [Lactuca sativa]|uniref:T-complex protein 1 subunit theta n=1 Tax=Lactuca sativa TaxID=4236 RepID=UPI000CD8BEE1|nr:T-complex protein 1 subunit theta [Lactuca sativa]